MITSPITAFSVAWYSKNHFYKYKGIFELRNTVVRLQHWGTIKYNIAQIYIRLFTEALKSEQSYARQLTFEMQFSLLGNRKEIQQTWLETFAFSVSYSFLVNAFLSVSRLMLCSLSSPIQFSNKENEQSREPLTRRKWGPLVFVLSVLQEQLFSH